jgi:hypothetical protein
VIVEVRFLRVPRNLHLPPSPVCSAPQAKQDSPASFYYTISVDDAVSARAEDSVLSVMVGSPKELLLLVVFVESISHRVSVMDKQLFTNRLGVCKKPKVSSILGTVHLSQGHRCSPLAMGAKV